MATEDYLPPAGSLLVMLDTFADNLNLSEDCDSLLRGGISAFSAYALLKQFTGSEQVERELETAPDKSALVTEIIAQITRGQRPVVSDEKLSNLVLNTQVSRGKIAGITRTCSVVQAMQLVDEFCDKFGIQTIGEKELKFALPLDSMLPLIHSLASDDRGFRDHACKEFLIVSKCRRIRLERKINSSTDPIMSIVPVNRKELFDSVPTASTPSTEASSTPCASPEPRFEESFPLHMRSVLKHSGPEVVMALSLTGIEGLINRWVRANLPPRPQQFLKSFPFDCVVRAIKASPGSVFHAVELIEESLKTKGRYHFNSISVLKKKVLEVAQENELPSEVRETLLSRISCSYAHMIVFKQIRRKDSIPLNTGGKQITLKTMRFLLKRNVVEYSSDEEASDEPGEFSPVSMSLVNMDITSPHIITHCVQQTQLPESSLPEPVHVSETEIAISKHVVMAPYMSTEEPEVLYGDLIDI